MRGPCDLCSVYHHLEACDVCNRDICFLCSAEFRMCKECHEKSINPKPQEDDDIKA